MHLQHIRTLYLFESSTSSTHATCITIEFYRSIGKKKMMMVMIRMGTVGRKKYESVWYVLKVKRDNGYSLLVVACGKVRWSHERERERVCTVSSLTICFLRFVMLDLAHFIEWWDQTRSRMDSLEKDRFIGRSDMHHAHLIFFVI